jgi:hypothetical protein
MAMLLVGSIGWGDLALLALDRLPSAKASLDAIVRKEFGLPLRAAIGIALFLAVGGVVVAAELAYLPFLYGWFVLGALVALARRARSTRFHLTVATRPILRVVVLVVVSLVVAAVAYGPAIDGPYNANDDDAAYLYLAQRLLSTGGLIDPFNMRRISSYGGGELLQALALGTSGNSAGRGIEWFFFALLATALVVRSARRRGAALAIAVIGLLLVLGDPVGIWANVAPTFSGVALTVALLQLLAVARRTADLRLYAIAGLFIAALLSLRLEFALPGGIALVLTALSEQRLRQRLTAIGTAAGCGVVALIGWALALDASSGTLLFPLESGNWNTTFPWRDPAISATVARLDFLRGELATDRFGLEVAASLAVSLVLLVRVRRHRARDELRPGALVLMFASIGCLLQTIVETSALSGGTFADIGRYDAPTACACLLIAIDLVWQTATSAAPALSQTPPAPVPHRPTTLALGAVIAVGLLLATIGEPLGVYRAALPHDLRTAGSILDGSSGFVDRWSGLRPLYTKINNLVAPGSRLLAAVDQPGLLDAKRFNFATLDVVGAASPTPGIPVFSGGLAVVRYLRRLGYNGVVASATQASGLYSFASWQANETSGIYDYRVMARYFIAWSKDLSQIRHDPAVSAHQAGTLVLLTW